MRAVQVVVFQAVVGWCTSEPREALLRYSWQESLLSARGLGEWRLPLRSAGWGVDGFALVGMYEWCPSQHRAGLGAPAICVSTLQC